MEILGPCVMKPLEYLNRMFTVAEKRTGRGTFIKAYGKNTWDNPENLDVMKWFDKNISEEYKEHDVLHYFSVLFSSQGHG